MPREQPPVAHADARSRPSSGSRGPPRPLVASSDAMSAARTSSAPSGGAGTSWNSASSRRMPQQEVAESTRSAEQAGHPLGATRRARARPRPPPAPGRAGAAPRRAPDRGRRRARTRRAGIPACERRSRRVSASSAGRRPRRVPSKPASGETARGSGPAGSSARRQRISRLRSSSNGVTWARYPRPFAPLVARARSRTPARRASRRRARSPP